MFFFFFLFPIRIPRRQSLAVLVYSLPDERTSVAICDPTEHGVVCCPVLLLVVYYQSSHLAFSIEKTVTYYYHLFCLNLNESGLEDTREKEKETTVSFSLGRRVDGHRTREA